MLREEFPAAPILGLIGILVLWIVMTQDVWLSYDFRTRANSRRLAYMYISVLWAIYASVLMVVGVWWRRRLVRYVGLGIFVLLLAKIFLVDTTTLDVMYRIAGFLATGLALVGVSYLYQYLKKMGVFETTRPNGDAAEGRRGADDA